jgi:2'-5' RNA ligase
MADRTSSLVLSTERMRDHWWWRPGWRVGRRLYTWHLTFAGQDELYELVAAYQGSLAGLPGLDLVPREWLHLTMQGIGFTDEVSQADVDRMRTAATKRLRGIPPLELTFGPVMLRAEAVTLAPSPPEPVAAVRAAIREAMATVWGEDGVPESAEGFRPHVSIAYSNRDGEVAPIVGRIEQASRAPITITVSAASLIVINRDERVYQWETLASVPLGGPLSPTRTG